MKCPCQEHAEVISILPASLPSSCHHYLHIPDESQRIHGPDLLLAALFQTPLQLPSSQDAIPYVWLYELLAALILGTLKNERNFMHHLKIMSRKWTYPQVLLSSGVMLNIQLYNSTCQILIISHQWLCWGRPTPAPLRSAHLEERTGLTVNSSALPQAWPHQSCLSLNKGNKKG